MGRDELGEAETDPLAAAATLIALADRVVAEGPPLAGRRSRRRTPR